MARPSIYNWDMLKQAYESGISKDEICTKYKIAKNILTNKINKDGWTIKCDINNDIIEFGAKLNAITQNYKDNSLMQEVIIDKLNTQLQDNEIIKNNRDLALMLQRTIIRDRDEINIKNIKTVSSTLKDLESIANPRPDVQINNTTEVKVMQIEFI